MRVVIDKNSGKRELFIAIFNVIKNCSTIVNMIFKEDYLYIQSMDRAHVCLFEVKIKKEWFSIYTKKTGDIEVIGMTTQTLFSILSTSTPSHDIVLHYEGNPDSLNIDVTLNKSDKGEFDCFYKIPIVNCDYDLLDIPDTEYDAEFSMTAKKASDIISRMSLFGETIQCHCDEERVDFIANGVNGEMKVNIPIDDLNEYAISEGVEVNLGYNLNYLNKMCITNRLSDNIEFYISNNCPMKIKYDLGEESRLLFYLAPKCNI
jgi:proliferating cell nuclear antigen PCNA